MSVLVADKAIYDALTVQQKAAIRTASARLSIGEFAVVRDPANKLWLAADDHRFGDPTPWLAAAAAAGFPNAIQFFPYGLPAGWSAAT